MWVKDYNTEWLVGISSSSVNIEQQQQELFQAVIIALFVHTILVNSNQFQASTCIRAQYAAN